MQGYEIREYRDGDETSLLATFNHVFGTGDPNFVQRTLAEWNWGFKENPAGSRIFVGTYNGDVVAQFAGQPLRMWVDATPQTFVHCVDSMSHPDHRKGLKRPGLFITTAQAYFEAYGGPDRDWVHFGLPIEEAARVGDKFLEYEVVRNEIFLARELGEGPSEIPGEVRVIERFDHQAKWVFDRCCGRWPAAAIRDDAFYNWRYLDHPRFEYVPLGVFDGDELLRGIAIYRKADWVLPEMGFIVDWMVPPEEPEVGELLVQAVLARARADQARAVAVTIPEWSPWFAMFQDMGWLVHPSDYVMRVRPFHPKHGTLWLRDGWWYQLGDADLV